MPLYLLGCHTCDVEVEKIMGMEETALCPKCGAEMRKLPTYPAMVKIKGEGGYPSRRKFVKGTAPYTTRDSKAWLDTEPKS